MPTFSQIQVSEGSGKNVAAYQFTESATAKQLQRIVANDSNGNEKGVNPLATIIQNTSNVSSGSVASLVKAFGNNNLAGNTIIVVCAVGNGTAPTVSDSQSNTYSQAAAAPNSTTFGSAIFFATNIKAGANTVTVTNGGANASMALEIYEIYGLLAVQSAQPGVTATASGSSATAATSTISPATPNRLVFAGVALGTAAQTITPATGWTNDSGQQNPSTPAGLYSFISMSQYLGTIGAITPSATFTSEPWAIAVASFRVLSTNVEGTVEITDGINTANVLSPGSAPAGQNALLTSGTGYTTPTITLNSSTPNTSWYDMLNYAWVSVEILTNTTPATLTFQTSGDASETNPRSTPLFDSQSTNNTSSLTTTGTTQTYYGPRTGRYFRVSSNNGAGTTTLVITFYTFPSGIPTIGVSGSVSSNSATGSAVPANAFYLAAGGGGNLVGIGSATGDGVSGGTSGTASLSTANNLYNGSTWDRGRNNVNTTTGDTPTLTSTSVSNGALQTNYNARGALVTAIMGTVSGSATTLVMQLQVSVDGGTTWINYGSATSAVTVATGNTVSVLSYPGIAASPTIGGAGSIANSIPLPRTWRCTYTGAGVGFSIAIASVQVNYIL